MFQILHIFTKGVESFEFLPLMRLKADLGIFRKTLDEFESPKQTDGGVVMGQNLDQIGTKH